MYKYLLILAALACSCVPSKKVCEPLESRECFCADGVPGLQYCVSDGEWWTLCDCSCRPDCGSRLCGDDGCGGVCGECLNNCTGEVDPDLCIDGRCGRECCPHTCESIDKECGSWHDGCGGFIDCGGCEPGDDCHQGKCCLPDCLGKNCGEDGCGGSCGSCFNMCTGSMDTDLCVDSVCEWVCCPATCEEQEIECGMGDDGCGIFLDCGLCPSGQRCIQGTCCEPDCGDRRCGSDGCGGTCGSYRCDVCDTCDPDGQCVGNCDSLLVRGRAELTIYPSEAKKLLVVLYGGPPGESVYFEIIGDSYGSTLSSNVAVVSAEHNAEVTLTAGDPGLEERVFYVWAHRQGDFVGTYYTVNLRPIVREIEVELTSRLQIHTGRSQDLTVVAVGAWEDTPLNGAEISFTIQNPPQGGDATIGDSPVFTDRLGRASAVFRSGTVATRYHVVAEGVSEDVGSVMFVVNVTENPAGECSMDSDCPAGFICVEGLCVDIGGLDCFDDYDCPRGYECRGGYCRPVGQLPETCAVAEDCPKGYLCSERLCFACPEDSQQMNCMQTRLSCQTEMDCPPGFVCNKWFCYPDNGPNAVIPGLGGFWNTSYYFDMSESIGGLSTVDILNSLNAYFNYCEITGIGFVDDMICEYNTPPEWSDALLDIFANLPNILSELRASGGTVLVHLNPAELVSGLEVWKTLRFRYLHQCCAGQPDPCNPYNQPDFPDCATVEFTQEELAESNVDLWVKPLTGKIRADDPDILLLDPREVWIDYSELVSMLVDRLVQTQIGFKDLDEALENSQDCDMIQCLVDCLLGSWAPDIRQACENFKPTANSLMRSLTNQIGPGDKIVRFTGWATISGDGEYQVGSPDFETRHDGDLWGECVIVLSGDIDGAWYWER